MKMKVPKKLLLPYLIFTLIIAVLVAVAIIWAVNLAIDALEPTPEPTPEPTLECVPAACCHSTSCVPADKAPDCSDLFCTQECVPGTLDCQQGSCQTVNEKCEAVFVE